MAASSRLGTQPRPAVAQDCASRPSGTRRRNRLPRVYRLRRATGGDARICPRPSIRSGCTRYAPLAKEHGGARQGRTDQFLS
jgi:hypothetical protein